MQEVVRLIAQTLHIVDVACEVQVAPVANSSGQAGFENAGDLVVSWKLFCAQSNVLSSNRRWDLMTLMTTSLMKGRGNTDGVFGQCRFDRFQEFGTECPTSVALIRQTATH